jgi:hypothetical protein
MMGVPVSVAAVHGGQGERGGSVAYRTGEELRVVTGFKYRTGVRAVPVQGQADR